MILAIALIIGAAANAIDLDVCALLQAEAQATRIHYTGLSRPRGEFTSRNLRACDAQYLKLSGFNFHAADLRSVDFLGADLRWSDLTDADLRDAIMVSTFLQGATFNAKTKLPFSLTEAVRRGMALK